MAKVKIISDSRILAGKPIIVGTRISVELIINFLSAGMSVEDILKEYTELRKSEVLVAIDYAKKLVTVPLRHEDLAKSTAILHEITR